MRALPDTAVLAVEDKPLTRRALAKLETRGKVLAAARRLFSECGYDKATIRDIAGAAGMSTGAVFANFSDKSDLFQQIVADDLTELLAQMRGAARAKDVDGALLALFMTGYAFYQEHMQLARAILRVSWTAEDGKIVRQTPALLEIRGLFREVIDAGVARGELIADPDAETRSAMLYEAYLSNFQNAIFGGWTLDALEAHARRQICILLASVHKA